MRWRARAANAAAGLGRAAWRAQVGLSVARPWAPEPPVDGAVGSRWREEIGSCTYDAMKRALRELGTESFTV